MLPFFCTDPLLPHVTQKLSLLLGGCSAKKHNEAKDQEKEGFIITCSKENIEDVSQSSIVSLGIILFFFFPLSRVLRHVGY